MMCLYVYIEFLSKIWIGHQINTWAFPYWPGYHPETPIYGSRDDNQANMEMPLY